MITCPSLGGLGFRALEDGGSIKGVGIDIGFFLGLVHGSTDALRFTPVGRRVYGLH